MNDIKSKFLRLNLFDFAKGIVVSTLGAAAQAAIDSISAGGLHLDWTHIGNAALVAGLAYLTKNLLSGSSK